MKAEQEIFYLALEKACLVIKVLAGKFKLSMDLDNSSGSEVFELPKIESNNLLKLSFRFRVNDVLPILCLLIKSSEILCL